MVTRRPQLRSGSSARRKFRSTAPHNSLHRTLLPRLWRFTSTPVLLRATFLIAFLWVIPFSIDATSPVELAINEARRELEHVNQAVAAASWAASVTVGLNILTASLGLIAGVLPSLRRRWTKYVGLVIGVVIGLVAIFNNNIYGVDSRAVWLAIAGVEQDAEELQDKILVYDADMSVPDQEQLRQFILQSLVQVRRERLALRQTSSKFGRQQASASVSQLRESTFGWIAVLDAQVPTIKQFKSRPQVMESVGGPIITASAEADSLVAATDGAEKAVLAAAAKYLNDQRRRRDLPVRDEAGLSAFVRTVATDVESSVELVHVGAGRRYRVYMSWTIPGVFRDPDLVLGDVRPGDFAQTFFLRSYQTWHYEDAEIILMQVVTSQNEAVRVSIDRYPDGHYDSQHRQMLVNRKSIRVGDVVDFALGDVRYHLRMVAIKLDSPNELSGVEFVLTKAGG
jgi:hypothetical protein